MNSVSVNIFINIARLFADINEPESRMSSTLIIQLLLVPEDKTSFKINIRRPYLSFPQSQHLTPVRSSSVLAQKLKLIDLNWRFLSFKRGAGCSHVVKFVLYSYLKG